MKSNWTSRVQTLAWIPQSIIPVYVCIREINLKRGITITLFRIEYIKDYMLYTLINIIFVFIFAFSLMILRTMKSLIKTSPLSLIHSLQKLQRILPYNLMPAFDLRSLLLAFEKLQICLRWYKHNNYEVTDSLFVVLEVFLG